MGEINIMTGIQNVLLFINSNWTAIMIMIALLNALVIRIRQYVSANNEEKIEIAKAQIREVILRLCTEAEVDYLEWVSAGSIKRAQVIDQIFETYPILSKVTDQASLIAWIDETIDEALETMRDIFEENADGSDENAESVEE